MHVIGQDAWVALSVFCAVWCAAMGAVIALVSRMALAPLWIACVWVLQEALRGRVPWGGFPWGNLSFAAADSPLAGWAPWLGAAGVTFITVFAGAAIVAATVRPWRPGRLIWLLTPVVLIGGGALLPAALIASDASTAQVAVIQGGTPQLGMGAMDVRRAVLDNHVKQTLNLARDVSRGLVQQPDMVIWPENASDLDPYQVPSVAAAITAAARAVKAPILVGTVVFPPGDSQGVWNAGIVWDPQTGPGERYIKNHPVPFGEYIPLRSVIARLVGRFDRVPRDFRAGSQPGVLTIAGVRVGDAICFEVAYGEVMRALISGGAQLLTVQTNNATYGDTAQPDQQFAIERFRARETGRFMAVAATTGISGFIDPAGQVVSMLPQDTVGYLALTVPMSERRTPAITLGPLLELVLCALALVSAAVAIVTRRRVKLPPSMK
jgi:apolipoprotein N-acyltransferase